MERDKKRVVYSNDTISLKLMLWLLLSVSVTYSLAAVFYPERFTFTYHAFSHLGKIWTSSGFENIPSFIITGVGMLACAWVMFRMAGTHTRLKPVPNSRFYAVFSGISSLGFVMMVFPCDVPEIRFLHVLGSAFVFGGLYFLLVLRLVAIRVFLGIIFTLIIFLIFNAFVFTYFWKWFIKSPVNPLYQKLALIFLIGGLIHFLIIH